MWMSRTISRSQGNCCSVTKLADGLLPLSFLSLCRISSDYLVTGGILLINPAASVRGPKYVGKTSVLSADQACQLRDTINPSELIGLRDWALIGLMVFSFARVGAANTI
jgi:site-specific recombinase XerC